MKEYKVERAKSEEQAEELMNRHAADGWRVVSTAYWSQIGGGLIITFEREKAEDIK